MRKIVINVSDGLYDRLNTLAEHQSNTVASVIRTMITDTLDYKDGRKKKNKKEEKSELEVIKEGIESRKVPTMGLHDNPLGVGVPISTTIAPPLPSTACVSLFEAKLLAEFRNDRKSLESVVVLPDWVNLAKELIICGFLTEVKKQDGSIWYEKKKNWVVKGAHEQQDCCRRRYEQH